MAERRQMLQRVEQPEVFEGEIVDAPFGRFNKPDEREREREHEVRLKILESLPDVVNIFKDIVDIHKVELASEAEIKRMDKGIDLMRVQTEDFVRREIEKRQTMQSKSERVQSMLRDLYAYLNQSHISDEVKEKVLDTFDCAIKSALKEK